MPTTKTYTVYTFDELSPQAQENALDKMRDINVDFDDWHDYILDYWQDEKLPERGFNDSNIHYSGFWSQGDGACFTANVDVLQFLKFHKLTNKYRAVYAALQNNFLSQGDINYKITHNDRYYHEFTMKIDEEYYDISDKAYNQAVKLESVILGHARQYAKEIYNDLEDGYNAAREDENVKDTILANSYTFDELGNPKQ